MIQTEVILKVDDSWNKTLIIVLVLYLYLFLFWVCTVSRVVAFQPGHFFLGGGRGMFPSDDDTVNSELVKKTQFFITNPLFLCPRNAS